MVLTFEAAEVSRSHATDPHDTRLIKQANEDSDVDGMMVYYPIYGGRQVCAECCRLSCWAEKGRSRHWLAPHASPCSCS